MLDGAGRSPSIVVVDTLHKTGDVVEGHRTGEQFGCSLRGHMVAVEQHAQLQRVAVFGVVQVIAQRVDGLDLILRYHRPLKPSEPAGDVNLSYGLAGYKRVAWIHQVGVGHALVTEIGAG